MIEMMGIIRIKSRMNRNLPADLPGRAGVGK